MASTSPASGRAFGVLGLLFQLGMMFAYGFGSEFLNEGTSVGAEILIQYTLMMVFCLLGFGLLLSFLKYGTWSGMATALMVVAINIQLGFLMQKFWFNTFTNGFNNNDNVSATLRLNPAATGNFTLQSEISFYDHNQFIDVLPNALNLRLTVMSAISCLVAFTGFIGRVGLFETFFTTLIFNIGWNLCYYVNMHINLTRSVNPLIFDDFGTNNVYIYGSFFGLMMMIALNCKPSRADNESYVMNRVSALLGLMGTGFIFATFIAASFLYPVSRGSLSNNYQIMNIIFAMSASVIGTYLMSAILRGGNVGIREAMLGTISGGIMVGTLAGLMINMAIAVSTGLFAGIISAIWYSVIHPKLNKTSIFDSHGMMGAFWLVSIFGGVVLAPAMLRVYVNLGIGGSTLFNGITDLNLTDTNLASFQLIYAGVAGGTGLVLGLVAAIVSGILRNPEDDFNDAGLFVRGDYGMYNPNKDDEGVPAHDSAGNLRGDN